MNIKSIPIGISNHHVHLTKDTYNRLFDEPISAMRELSQPGEFAAEQTLTLTANDKTIERVRVLGPFRPYDQVEISHYDAFLLGIDPPVRNSGDLEGAETITLKTAKASITIPACILAKRHIHISTEQAKSLNITNDQKLSLKISGDRSGVLDIYAKITAQGTLEAHLDMDDANAFLLKTGDQAELLLP